MPKHQTFYFAESDGMALRRSVKTAAAQLNGTVYMALLCYNRHSKNLK